MANSITELEAILPSEKYSITIRPDEFSYTGNVATRVWYDGELIGLRSAPDDDEYCKYWLRDVVEHAELILAEETHTLVERDLNNCSNLKKNLTLWRLKNG